MIQNTLPMKQRLHQLNIFKIDESDPQTKSNSDSPSTKTTTNFFKPSIQSQEPKQSKKWTRKENDIFFNVIAQYGNDITILLRELRFRTVPQINCHIDLMFKRIKKNIIYLRAIEDIEERYYKTHMVKQILFSFGTKFEKEKYEIHVSKEIAIEILRIVNKIIPLDDNEISDIFSMLSDNNQLSCIEDIQSEVCDDNISIPITNTNPTISDCEQIEEKDKITHIPDIFLDKSINCSTNEDKVNQENECQFLKKKRHSMQSKLESTKNEDYTSQLDLFNSFFNNELFFGTSINKSKSADLLKEKAVNNNDLLRQETVKVSEKTRTPLTEEDVLIYNPFNLSFDDEFFSSPNENEIININYSYSYVSSNSGKQ